MMRLAVFASGAGSNFAAICDANVPGVEVALLFCDRPKARVLGLAEERGVPTLCFQPSACATRDEYERAIVDMVEEAQIDVIALAGYMRIIHQPLLDAFAGRIINIHPSLLPSFPGKDAIGQAFEAGVDTTGVTVHFVDSGIDTGPIIAQVPVKMCADRETLEEAVHSAEHELYPKVIEQLAREW